MENLDVTHPGAKDELKKIGISVRRNNIGVGQAIDLAGEQSYMRDAKTPGGITPFQTSKGTVLRVRSRPFQAKFTEALRSKTNIDRTTDLSLVKPQQTTCQVNTNRIHHNQQVMDPYTWSFWDNKSHHHSFIYFDSIDKHESFDQLLCLRHNGTLSRWKVPPL